MKKIRSKLMLAMLAISCAIAIVLSAVSIYYINKSTNDTLLSAVQPLAILGAKNFNVTMRQYCISFSDAASGDAFANAETDADRLNVLKTKFSAGINEYCTFAVYNTDGTLSQTENKEISSSITEANVLDAASKSSFIVTDLVTYNPNIYFSILQTEKLGNGKKCVAAVTIDAQALKNLILDNSFGTSGYAYLMDNDGNILIHKDSSMALNKFNAINEAKNDDKYEDVARVTEEILKQDDGACSYTYEEQDLVAGYAYTDYFNSTIVLVSNMDDFTSSTQTALMSILILGVALIGVTILISLLFARLISKPITSATKRIRLLAQGNLSDPVDVWYSKDELGILTNSLEETIVSLRQYINLITVALKQISEGNLCHRMEGTFKGDFEQIKTSFNEILDSLSDTFASINTAAQQVTSGAVQVSNSAQAVSQGSTQQASAIEELSATLNDISKQVQQNSKDAKDAYKIVNRSTQATGSCNDDMAKMLAAMNAIDSSTSEIAKIIKVIDEISFQTNILALNAAVEAAREGSKGFGVVADEVRLLASRSAEAAKQTAALIENSTAAVAKGSQIAEKTASSLNDIVESSKEILSLVKNITDASEAQSNAIVQINTGLDQVSAVVSANTSTSVGTASASEELSSQSLILKNMIARFKLSDEEDRNKSKFNYDYDYDSSEPVEPAQTAESYGNYDYNDEDLNEFTEYSEDDKY